MTGGKRMGKTGPIPNAEVWSLTLADKLKWKKEAVEIPERLELGVGDLRRNVYLANNKAVYKATF